MSNKLDQLRQFSDVVADTGDIVAIKRFEPLDATTNPSLLLKAASLDDYQPLIREHAAALQPGSSTEDMRSTVNRLAVAIGSEIAAIVPGRVSTEIDAHLSFDTQATIAQANEIMNLYAERGIGREKVLIKIASTWEGIKAAEHLEKQGINCNLTLLFSFDQARACADAGATLISPFVGRIYDWYKARGEAQTNPDEDRGVQSVKRIFNYFKAYNYKTIVMGASFRNTGQIEALAGCDRLTISPALLEELSLNENPLYQRLFADNAKSDDERCAVDEVAFRFRLNDDAMATEKLAEGIRLFAADQRKLQKLLMEMS
ncbi:transaldolase [Litorivivens sp.]|uniref:transaldolase n=1 Tax=Litorivivens sp. TaxID=2020868 RepID=UPI003566A251